MKTIFKSSSIVTNHNKKNELVIVSFERDEAYFKLEGKYSEIWDMIPESGITAPELAKQTNTPLEKIEEFIAALSERSLISLK